MLHVFSINRVKVISTQIMTINIQKLREYLPCLFCLYMGIGARLRDLSNDHVTRYNCYIGIGLPRAQISWSANSYSMGERDDPRIRSLFQFLLGSVTEHAALTQMARQKGKGHGNAPYFNITRTSRALRYARAWSYQDGRLAPLRPSQSKLKLNTIEGCRKA